MSARISGLVVEYSIAIAVTRVRFPADALLASAAKSASAAPLGAKMRQPGIEPGAQAWEACMLPLHY